MTLPSLRLVAAQNVVGLLSSDDLARVADDLLTGGVYSPSLGELAATSYPIMSEVGPLFVAALRELGVPSPSSEEAWRTVAWYCLIDVAEGRAAPWERLHCLGHTIEFPEEADVVRALEPWGGRDLPALCSEYSYLETLVADGYIGPEELASRRATLDGQAVEIASRFARGYCPVPVEPSWLVWGGGVVPRLARALRDGGRFEDLPVLADALEEAGCSDPEVLDHCRQARGHAGWCWILDLLLAKK